MNCPICLENLCNITTPCKHPICKKCIERIIFNKRLHILRSNSDGIERTQEQVEDTIISCTPSYARCPTCRRMLYVFDLEKHSDYENMNLGNAYEKEYGMGPLEGYVFTLDGNLGLGSLHFAMDNNNNETISQSSSGSGSAQAKGFKPYVSFENENVHEKMGSLDDGTPLPSRLEFSPGFHFHTKTNTFFGTVDLDSSWYGSKKWEYIVQFSPNLEFVCGGCIIMHREVNDNTCFAFDGVWELSSSFSSLESRITGHVKIEVVAGSYAYEPFGYNHHLDFSKPGSVSITYQAVNRTITQRNSSKFNLEKNPHGPDVGKSFLWNSTLSKFSKIVWTRQSVIDANTPLSPRVVPFGPGGRSLLRHHTYTPLISTPSYNKQSLWGNTFVQCNLIGLASFHFIDINEEYGAYISYEHPDTASWGTLDNGTPVPPRVPFRNMKYNVDKRMFRGVIEWKNDFETSWNGAVSWKYEMIFDPEFHRIESGHVRMFSERNVESTKHFDGESMMYFNARVENQ